MIPLKIWSDDSNWSGQWTFYRFFHASPDERYSSVIKSSTMSRQQFTQLGQPYTDPWNKPFSKNTRPSHRMESLNARPGRHKEPCATTFLTSWPRCRSIKRGTKQRSRKLAATAQRSLCRSDKSALRTSNQYLQLLATLAHGKAKSGPKCWNCGGTRRSIPRMGATKGENEKWIALWSTLALP